MIFFALFMVPFFGCLTAITARRRIAAEPPSLPPFDTIFYRGLFVIIAVHIPARGYLYYAYTDWALGYLVDPLRLPLMFGFVLVSFAFVGYFFGFLATQALLRAHKPLMAMLAAGQMGLAVLIFAVLFHREAVTVGTYFEFHTGTARMIASGNGLFEIAFAAFLFTLSGLVVLLWNAKEDTRYPALEFEDSKW
jgi:hypothetical protein